MRFRLFVAPILAATFIATTIPACSQVKPAGYSSGIPLVVGAGFSNYNIDWGGDRRELGGTIWADWTIRQVPRVLQGVGVELEARDLSLDPPAVVSFFRYDTAGGGVIYHVLRPRNIHPYAKFGAGFGSFDFAQPPGYTHDTRSYLAMGGGADFHAWHNVWIRADYEYQVWRHLFGSPNALTPNGFTFGPEFDFGAPRER